MIDDTRESAPTSYPASLSQEVLQIIQYRADRHDALDWAKNLRFLAFDDSSHFPGSGGPAGKQECSHCHAKPRSPASPDEYFDAEIIHVCDKPFHNKHTISEEDVKTHCQRFSCDLCHRNIYGGMRHHCGTCLSSNFDACDSCIDQGKTCLDDEHILEKIPVFEFGDCVHVNARSCKDCESIPIFPSEGEVTKFQIVQLAGEGEFSSCDHFVAVSYCWPPPRYDEYGNMIQHEGVFDVTDASGRVRKNRAPEDVITRAVRFAVQNGIRLVWIDQECIDQDNAMDKELGIQAMDKVYQRAFLSIGLLRTTIEDTRGLEGLKYLLVGSDEFREDTAENEATADVADVVMAFFEPLIDDPWHSRAWILQEAFSAGSRMCLLVQHSQEINIKVFPGISRILSKSEVVIQLDLFLVLIDYARGYLNRSLLTLSSTHPLSKRRANLLMRFRDFIPGEERSIEAKWTHQAGKTRARRSCSAAVALSYLRTRQNTCTPDRLAILANLCNYDIRVDTVELDKKHYHLSTCILALALMNRDFSLFYPEVYDMSNDGQSSNSNQTEFSWMTTSATKLQLLDARNINSLTHYFHYFPAAESISDKGLKINGYLWKIYRRITLPELNIGSNAQGWFLTRHSLSVFNSIRSTNYTPNTWKQIDKSRTFQDLDQPKKDEFTSSISKGDGMSPEEYEHWASDLRGKILKQVPPDAELQFQAITSAYLVRILYLLREKNELVVADAIWQSIRKDNWNIRLSVAENQARGWFNSVGDFPPMKEDGTMPMNVQVMMDMLQLDVSKDGGFHQCWIVDSVLRDGWIAVGKFVRLSRDEEFFMRDEWIKNAEDVGSETADDEINRSSKHQELEAVPDIPSTLPDTPIQSALVSSQSVTTEVEEQAKPYDFSEHGDVQLFSQLMKSSFLSLIEDLPSRNRANGIPLPVTTQSLQEMQNIFGAAMLYGRMNSDWMEAESGHGVGKLGSMRAVFDVNEIVGGDAMLWENGQAEKPIWVLTPYDERTERLPHTEARAMSMSWVVKPTGESSDEKEGPGEIFRTTGNVKGMWRLMDRPLTEYLLV